MSEDLDDARLTTVGLLAEFWAGFSAKALAQVAAHGLDGVEFEVLLRLARSPEGSLRMSDLAAQTSLTASGVTRVVDRLVADALVARRACSTDRRTTYAEISEAGRSRLQEALPGHVALVEEWITSLLTEAQQEQLVATLRVLRDAVRPCAEAGAHRLAPEVPLPR